ncbi:ADP-ribosylation factor GTPase-activating protein AGD12 isoform X2 [Arachis ipaensis]|uniref:ADP-ribosylation factor GTPase-activating protein AGD12 isoform X2 n=1 Tax=Arachis ipaensis TaxID=130454 RepID=UPI000A2B208E|nr:ADP-ribosylation factor GTPase-activating protein AGD12 isoform X2 [Arachis ipaensis]
MSVAMRNKPLEFGRPVKSKRKFKDLLLQKDNQFCADCNAPQPKWASANIGVFLCFKCYNVHRSLDTHISRVLSVGDEWSDDDIDAMIEVGGNSSANSIYEAYIPEGYAKPRPDSSQEERTKFIRSKYEYQEFLKPSLRIVSSKSSHQSSFSKHNADSFRSSYESSFSKRDAHSFRSSHEPSFSMRSADSFRSCHESSFSQCDADSFRSTTSLKNLERTREFIGKLQVKVIKGTNLAIRDMMTSDPYVVLKLGKQKVFDHDLFSADDIMGEAQVDLQPLIASAMAFGDAGMFDDMQIGKWLKSHDNALKHDSTVNIINGKVKQEISLKLQHVECGELDLELEWIPL